MKSIAEIFDNSKELLHSISNFVDKYIGTSQTDKKHKCALIFDDSLYARGKGTDLCGKVFDHNTHRMRLGYRMMTGGWTNGEAFIPFTRRSSPPGTKHSWSARTARWTGAPSAAGAGLPRRKKEPILYAAWLQKLKRRGFPLILCCLTHGFPILPSSLN